MSHSGSVLSRPIVGGMTPSRRACVSHDGENFNRLYGEIWLLERVADMTGLRKDLMSVFGGNDNAALPKHHGAAKAVMYGGISQYQSPKAKVNGNLSAEKLTLKKATLR